MYIYKHIHIVGLLELHLKFTYLTWLVNTTPHRAGATLLPLCLYRGRAFPRLSSQTLQVNQCACMTLITYCLGIAENTEIEKRKETQRIPKLLLELPH